MSSLLFCTSCWLLYYTLLHRVNKTCSPEWNSRVVAFTHALLVVQGSGLCLFKWPLSMEELDQENTSCQINVIYFSLSYFIFDTCWCMYMQTERIVIFIHHFGMLALLSTSLYLEIYGYASMLILFAGEITNPMLQIRWFLRSKELHFTTFAVVNEALFVILFTIARLFFGSYLLYVLLLRGMNIIVKCIGTVLQIVNYAFMYEVFLLVKKKILLKMALILHITLK